MVEALLYLIAPKPRQGRQNVAQRVSAGNTAEIPAFLKKHRIQDDPRFVLD